MKKLFFRKWNNKIFVFIGYSQLQCYVCNNCATVNSETPYLTCGDNISTEGPLTTTTEYTTISSTTNADVSSTTQSVTTDSTTSAITQTSTEAPSTTQEITTQMALLIRPLKFTLQHS